MSKYIPEHCGSAITQQVCKAGHDSNTCTDNFTLTVRMNQRTGEETLVDRLSYLSSRKRPLSWL